MTGRPPPGPGAPGLANWALIVVLGIIWGATFMGVSVALEGFGPWTVTAGRTLIGAIVLLLAGPLVGQGVTLLRGPGVWRAVALVGTVSVALPFALLSLGLGLVPSAFAGVSMGAVPLLVLPLVAIFSPEEGIGPRRVAGMALGFAGLVVLMGPGALQGVEGPATLLGRLACIGAAGCYAAGSILTRRAPPMPPVAFATGTLVVAALVLVPLAIAVEGVPADLPAAFGSGPGLALLAVAIGPTALAAIIRVRVITTAGSLFMSLTSYMVPVWAVVFGTVLLDEAPGWPLFAALGLILSGILLSQWRAQATGRPGTGDGTSPPRRAFRS